MNMNTTTNNEKMRTFEDALANYGHELAQQAIQQADEAEQTWERTKIMLQLADSLGQREDALRSLFAPGERMPQRKASWYRKHKRLVKLALQYDLDFSKLSVRETEAAIAEARESRRTPADKKADSLRMMKRTFKGALEKVDHSELLSNLQEVIGVPTPAPAPARSKPKRAAAKA